MKSNHIKKMENWKENIPYEQKKEVLLTLLAQEKNIEYSLFFQNVLKDNERDDFIESLLLKEKI